MVVLAYYTHLPQQLLQPHLPPHHYLLYGIFLLVVYTPTPIHTPKPTTTYPLMSPEKFVVSTRLSQPRCYLTLLPRSIHTRIYEPPLKQRRVNPQPIVVLMRYNLKERMRLG